GTLLSVPVITPGGNEYTIKAKENLKLTCKSYEDIIWSYPDVNATNNIHVNTSHEGVLRISELFINNANGLNVGFYFCNETGNPQSFASTYLYVDDNDQLSANVIPPQIYGKRYQSVIIPCKPSHPSVDVKLYSGFRTDGENEFQIQPDGSEWSYNRTVGFTLAHARKLYTHYTCLFQKNGANDERKMLTVIATKTFNFIHQPIIEQVNGSVYNVEGEALNLKCIVQTELSQTVTFTWKFNGNEIKVGGRYDIIDNFVESRAPQCLLQVKNITRNQDQGN
ncbi:Immunoglobulin, partial [Oryctes borbonicus]